MQDIDGLEMAAKMLQIRPEIKIMFITGYVTSHEQIEKALNSAAIIDLLEKPFSVSEGLCNKITEMVGSPRTV